MAYDEKYAPCLQLTYARHAEYCKKWNIDYHVRIGQVPRYENDAWAKIALIQEQLWWHDYVIWLDADTIIRDFETDIRRAFVSPINGVRWEHPLSHVQAGILFFRSDSLPLVDYMMNERKYYIKRFPGLRGWYEQGQLNEMAEDPHFKIHIAAIDDKWNWSELYMPPCLDVVIEAWHGESFDQFWPKMIARMAEIG